MHTWPTRRRPSSIQRGDGRLLPGAIKSKSVELLDPDRSAALRDKLLAEVANLASAEVAVTWANGALPAKNTLVATDAKLLEQAFEQKLSGLSPAVATETSTDAAAALAVTLREEQQASNARSDPPKGIDKSVLTVAAPRRYRNREHLRFVAQQACLVCGRKPSDPHHLRHVQPRALGRKASDEFAVPLCRSHHRAVHRASSEQRWWQAAGIDPVKIARKLWRHTRLKEGQIRAERRPQSTSSNAESKMCAADSGAA